MGNTDLGDLVWSYLLPGKHSTGSGKREDFCIESQHPSPYCSHWAVYPVLDPVQEAHLSFFFLCSNFLISLSLPSTLNSSEAHVFFFSFGFLPYLVFLITHLVCFFLQYLFLFGVIVLSFVGAITSMQRRLMPWFLPQCLYFLCSACYALLLLCSTLQSSRSHSPHPFSISYTLTTKLAAPFRFSSVPLSERGVGVFLSSILKVQLLTDFDSFCLVSSKLNILSLTTAIVLRYDLR